MERDRVVWQGVTNMMMALFAAIERAQYQDAETESVGQYCTFKITLKNQEYFRMHIEFIAWFCHFSSMTALHNQSVNL